MEDAAVQLLIASRDAADVRALKQTLCAEYTVIAARSGRTALKKAVDVKPDLILLGMELLDASDFDILAALREGGETGNIPVIMLTGLGGDEAEKRGFDLGAVDCISKPFHDVIVMARIKTHLRILRQMRTIERMGLTDALTELSNRRGFDARVNAEWGRSVREKTSLSLLMVDMDRFKAYNDTYGHAQGDAALKRIARILQAAAKRPADIAARWGGDEFMVLLPNTGLKGALRVAEAIRACVEEQTRSDADGRPMNDRDEPAVPVTISVGVAAAVPALRGSLSELLLRADRALYSVKAAGGNGVRY